MELERTTLPCGYVMGVHEALVTGIPGLKRETWGTLRVFPVILLQKEDLSLSYLQHSVFPQPVNSVPFQKA
jgi:hypothetical protein